MKRHREATGRLIIEGEKLRLLEEDHKMQVPQEWPMEARRLVQNQLAARGKSSAQSML